MRTHQNNSAEWLIKPAACGWLMLCACLVICSFSAVFAEESAETAQTSEAVKPTQTPQETEAAEPAVAAKADKTVETAVDPNLLENFENDLLLAKNPTTTPERQLWKARIEASDIDAADPVKDELKNLIKQVSAIKFEQPEMTSQSAESPETKMPADSTEKTHAPVEPVIKTEPNEIAIPESAASATEKPELPEGYITPETRAMFQQLLQQPKQLKNPLQLAEVLYQSECFGEAAICYQEAWIRLAADENDPCQNKAWILFQLGNCYQKVEPEKALEKFNAIVKDYPDCPWVDIAKAKSRYIDWRLTDKPVELMNAGKPAEVVAQKESLK